MKRTLWLVIVFLLLTPQSAALGNSQKEDILSSFPNSGFEINPTDPNNGWTWPGNDWVWDGNIAHSGTHSARVSRTGGSETQSIYSAYVSIQPSTIYTLTYWMRNQDATYWSSVMLYQYKSGGAGTGLWQIAYANIGNGSQDWSEVNYRFQTMPDATQLQLRLYLYTSTTGTFWFDDFSLDQGTPAIFSFQTGFPVKASGWAYQSSPTVADINQDGSNELLIGAGSAVNGWNKTGTQLPGFPLPTNDKSIIAQIALADLDKDGRLEIVAGTRTLNPPEGQCRVFAWQDNGTLLSGWPISVDWNTQYSNNDCIVTSVVLADINGDENEEILASTTNNASGDPDGDITPLNLYAWNANGTLVSGNWPNGHTTAGFYGALAAGDLNGDAIVDIIAGRDHHYLNAYSSAGTSMLGWPIETYLYANHGNYQTDLRIVHGLSAPVLADLDGNGSMEYIVIGNVDGPGNNTVIQNSALLVLNPDGTRWPGWETPALGNGVLTQEDLPQQAPAIADLNGDGKLEIVAATNDGWIRAYDADKNVLWAFNYTQGATLFASEPVIGDIDGDGAPEIVFGTHVPMQEGGNWDGPVGIWALKADGTVLPGFPLPVPTPGVRAAPTLADLDGDGKLDILIATMEGRIFVWDTPTTYHPDLLPWPTGRHDLQRSGSYTDVDSVILTINQSTGGTITADPAGPYHLNDPVTLTATPDVGWNFSAWTGDCAGYGNPCSLIMNGNKTVSAIFTTNTYTSTPTRTATLTPTPINTYTSTPTRTATLTSMPTNTYTSTPTRTATLTPTPINTYTSTPTRTATLTSMPTNTNTSTPTRTATLTSMPTNTNTSTPTRTATFTSMPTNTNTSTPTRTATFTPMATTTSTPTPTRTATIPPVPTNTYTSTPTQISTPTELPIIILTINPSTGGMITVSPVGPYHLNDVVTLTATAETDFTFFYWSGDAIGTANPTTITMNGNKTVGAYFQQGTLRENFDTLSGWTVKGGGTMTLDSVNYRQGIASVRLTMPVRNGYENITKSVHWDLSESQGDLKFLLFVSTTGSPTSFKILLSNNNTIKNYFLANIPIQLGWNLITLSTTDWAKYGKASWIQPFVQVQLQGLGSGGVYYLVDGLTTGDIILPGWPFTPGMGIFLPIISR